MKTLFCFLFLVSTNLIVENIIAQDVIKFRAKSFSFYNTDYQTGWSEWDDCNILIAIDLLDRRIKIYSSETNVFDIVREIEYYEGDNKVVECTTIDNNGVRCKAKFVYNENYNDKQLYIIYPEFSVAYSIKALTSY